MVVPPAPESEAAGEALLGARSTYLPAAAANPDATTAAGGRPTRLPRTTERSCDYRHNRHPRLEHITSIRPQYCPNPRVTQVSSSSLAANFRFRPGLTVRLAILG